ncbi:hypothetical protein CSAL01_02800 [Colletotrichum salicis]|uniref:Uncharacterized protein n=1 Tax=Colletotrichum salicis TaxID=1209931 RepID=A0A135SZH1_9PEZI|nr:hypothetical protein CSAL01_02800 [Colletotrichum salicis]
MHLDSQTVDIVEVFKKEKATLNARLEEATKKLATAMEAFESEKQERTKADIEANNRKIQSMNLEPIELMATEHHVHRPSSSGRTDSPTWAEYTANANIEDAKNTSSDEDTIEDCCWGHISRESKDAHGDPKSVKSSDSIECLTPSDSSARSNPASSVCYFSSEKEAPLFDQALTSDITTAFKEHVMHELKNGLKKELQTRVDGDFKSSLEQCLVQELSQKLTGEIKDRIYYELREDLMRILKRDITFKLQQDIKHELRLEMGSQLKYDIMEDVKNSVIAEIKETQKEINNELKSEIKGEVFNEIKEALKQDAMKELKDTIKAELKYDLLDIAHRKQ